MDWGTIPDWLDLIVGFIAEFIPLILERRNRGRGQLTRILIPLRSPLYYTLQTRTGALIFGATSGAFVGAVFGAIAGSIGKSTRWIPLWMRFPNPTDGLWVGLFQGLLLGMIGGFIAYLIGGDVIRLGARASAVGIFVFIFIGIMDVYSNGNININYGYLLLGAGFGIAMTLLTRRLY